MARIELSNLAHSYKPHPSAPADWAVKRMTMVWDDGGAYALLGPSGCGKTTLLNIISGLVTPSEGKVLFDHIDVTTLPTEQRNIAQVFQFPVIYDTMTVAENLAFPLRNRGVERYRIAERVKQVEAAWIARVPPAVAKAFAMGVETARARGPEARRPDMAPGSLASWRSRRNASSRCLNSSS